jgi:hypothetical protein
MAPGWHEPARLGSGRDEDEGGAPRALGIAASSPDGLTPGAVGMGVPVVGSAHPGTW